MIKHYIYGKPIETEAVIKTLPPTEGAVPYLVATETEEAYVFEYSMNTYDRLYGLGENVRGLTKEAISMKATVVMILCMMKEKVLYMVPIIFLLSKGKRLLDYSLICLVRSFLTVAILIKIN